MSKLSAKDYWHRKFGELPATDAEKLAVAMMTEFAEAYHAHELAAIRKEVDGHPLPYKNMVAEYYLPKTTVLAILDKHIKP